MASVAEILLAQGRHAADARRAKGGVWMPLVQSLANLPGQFREDRAAEQAAAVAGQDAQQRRDLVSLQMAREAGALQDQDTGRTNAAREREIRDAMLDVLNQPDIVSDDGFDLPRARQYAESKGWGSLLSGALVEADREQDSSALKGKTDRATLARLEAENEQRGTDARRTTNQAGVRRMMGEYVTARADQPPTPQDRRTLQGMAFQEGIPGADVDRLVPEEKPDTRSLQQQANDALRSGDTQGYSRIMRVIREAAAAERAPQTTSNDPGPLETIIGPDGKPIRVRREDAIGKTPASGTSRPASGLEKRAFNFFNRARQADIDLEALETDVQAMGLGGQARMALAHNVLQSETGQLYTQAQRAFTEARLRKDSGAAIPEQEFANDRRTYFVQPGDGPEVQAQKRRARAAVLASLSLESGQALAEFEGDTDAAGQIVEAYRQRSQRPTPTPQPGSGRGRTSGAGPVGQPRPIIVDGFEVFPN